MAQTKIGFSQVEKPAPLWYRRLSSALIMFLVPGAIGLVSGWGLSDRIANRWLMALGFVPALVKAVGILLGNGQVYAPTNEQIDNAAPLNQPPNP